MASLSITACSLVTDFSGIEETTTAGGGDMTTGSGGAGPPWLTATDPLRKRLILDTTVSDTDLVDVPVAVMLEDADLLRVATADGRDIAFSAADGVTQLDHEIEDFDLGTGKLMAWVRLPYVQVGVPTDVYIYFGDAQTKDREDLPGLWPSARFRGVWHMSQDPEMVGRPMLDSAGANDGRTDESEYPVSSPGIAGPALAFKDNARVSVPHSSDFDFGDAGSFSFSAWVRLGEYTPGDLVLSKAQPSGAGWLIALHEETNWQGTLLDGSKDGEGQPNVRSAKTDLIGNGPLGKWVQLAFVVNREQNNFAAYAQGKFKGQTELGTLGSVDSDAELLFSPGGATIVGLLDELRIYGVPLSAGWIALEYHNLTMGSKFVKAGALEEHL